MPNEELSIKAEEQFQKNTRLSIKIELLDKAASFRLKYFIIKL
jgi:hypothetical protein